MNKSNWWQTLFDKKYLDTYLDYLTPEKTKQEVDFIEQKVNLKSADKILDLACGHGRHAIELARRGYKVVGLDYSEPFISKARHDAKKAGVEVKFLQGDMKNLPFKQEFDVVITVFTTFGYFNDEQNQKVLYEINKALKPGGKFLIDVISGEAVLKRFKEEGEKVGNLLKIPRTFEAGGFTIDETELFDLKEQQIHTHREWVDEGEKQEYDYYLKVYTVPQYKNMLIKAGLEFKELWGDFNGNPHGKENIRTIILANKVD